MLKEQDGVRNVLCILSLHLGSGSESRIIDGQDPGELAQQILEWRDANLLYGIDGHASIVSPLELIEIVLVDIAGGNCQSHGREERMLYSSSASESGPRPSERYANVGLVRVRGFQNVPENHVIAIGNLTEAIERALVRPQIMAVSPAIAYDWASHQLTSSLAARADSTAAEQARHLVPRTFIKVCARIDVLIVG